jgi:hypothetical protein
MNPEPDIPDVQNVPETSTQNWRASTTAKNNETIYINVGTEIFRGGTR